MLDFIHSLPHFWWFLLGAGIAVLLMYGWSAYRKSRGKKEPVREVDTTMYK